MSENQKPQISVEQLLNWTNDIVCAHVKRNPISSADVPALINHVGNCLRELGEEPQEKKQDLVPAVAVKNSVTPDYLICLEDGYKGKMLKRHLMSAHGLTPEEYRAKWNLPPNYPMVASNYASRRSEIAFDIRLGQKKEAEAETKAEAKQTSTKKKPSKKSVQSQATETTEAMEQENASDATANVSPEDEDRLWEEAANPTSSSSFEELEAESSKQQDDESSDQDYEVIKDEYVDEGPPDDVYMKDEVSEEETVS